MFPGQLHGVLPGQLHDEQDLALFNPPWVSCHAMNVSLKISIEPIHLIMLKAVWGMISSHIPHRQIHAFKCTTILYNHSEEITN